MQKFHAVSKVIEAHNDRFERGLESFRMEHNELSDLTPQEMSSRMGVKVPANVEEMRANMTHHVMSSGYGVPASMDWRTKGAVGRVKNQGGCGSCYAFSASGALECAQFKKSGKLIDVSEQNIVDCTYGGSYGNHGCSGGWMWTAFKYIQDKNGVNGQNDYQYEGVLGQCRHKSDKHVMSVSSHVLIPKANEHALLDAVANQGAVAIAYNAGTQGHASYRSGILDVPNCGNNPTHATLVVGYGTEGGKDYWIVKNSWGEGWGEKGYFRLARGKNMCGVADWASYPCAK